MPEVPTAAAVVAPAPRATSKAFAAVAPLPMAMELDPMEVASGPIATESWPVAVESPRVELVWKYLIPRPLASAFSVLTLLFVVERPVESEVMPLALVLIPLDAEVESDETLLLVVDRPDDADVDSELMELALVLMPLEAEVESDDTLLLVVDRPEDAEVDKEPM